MLAIIWLFIRHMYFSITYVLHTAKELMQTVNQSVFVVYKYMQETQNMYTANLSIHKAQIVKSSHLVLNSCFCCIRKLLTDFYEVLVLIL